ncbi:MAG: L-seryl-tRNA(Sec) selenium transferase [Dehalococcoidia bacterium]|jgi:L-seryl-tRNA(Ser) seleniumtransferase
MNERRFQGEGSVANPYRRLPSIDRLIGDERVRGLTAAYSARAITDSAREELDAARRAIAAGEPCPPFDAIVSSLLERVAAAAAPTLRPVINATGIIIHTNLGRAPLSDDAIAAMEAAGRGYSNLEFDLDQSERNSRHVHLEGLLRRVTGAEAGIAVNNNAAAVLLALSALAAGKEVVISRGQLVEIGGGFRIPEIMAQSGAHLVEVGTTNRTYLSDYEAAISDSTAALLRVHTSNFRVVGFAASVPLADLARLTHERGLLLLDDLGSGCLLDTTRFGLAKEPTIQESLADGADLVFSSGDKLLGGPQAGIVVGRGNLVAALKRHPLARAARLDKTAVAALAATLGHYVKDEAEAQVPVWRMIAMPLPTIAARARRWARALGAATRDVDGRSLVGGGSLPEESLPTKLLAIGSPGVDVEALARRLRLGQTAVVARIEHDTLLLDPRTVDPREDRALVAALRAALAVD